MKKRNIKSWILICLLLTLLLGKILIWDNKDNKWIIEDLYYKPPFEKKQTVANDFKTINKNNYTEVEFSDATNLNFVKATDYRKPTTRNELITAVEDAKKNKKTISMSGARHSSNGQNLGEQIHLDLTNYDKVISFDENTKKVSVESGITWKQLQDFLGQKGFAIKIMQDSNIFTVGGSMGSNVHGKDVRYGSLIESISSFKLINPEGQEIKVNRTENPNLFRSVIGGFGMFGIITEVELFVEKNKVYDFVVTNNSSSQLVEKFDEFEKDKKSDMIEGHFSIAKDNLLEEVQIYYFNDNKNKAEFKDDISGENSIWLRKAVYRLSRVTEWGKSFRWWMQKYVSVSVDPQTSSRNNAMAAPFRVLQIDNPSNTDVLQEYFVPTSKVQDWLKFYKQQIKDYDINLVNCGVRKVKKDQEALVSYANEEMYGFVCYYNVSKDQSQNQKYFDFSTKITTNLNEIKGTVYLAYDFYENKDEILKMYPNINSLIMEKEKFDPNNIFYNKFYEKFKK
ncbi:MAG: FAD-binding protein [Patescibacteria group bacterium]